MNIEYVAFAMNLICLVVILVDYIDNKRPNFQSNVLNLLLLIKQKQENMAEKFEDDVRLILTEIDESTNNIASDIERWAVKVSEASGLASATQAQLLAEMRAAADKLRTTAAITPEEEVPVVVEEEIAPPAE